MKRSFGILSALLVGFLFGMAVPFAGAHDEAECDCPVCPEVDCAEVIEIKAEEDLAIKKALEAIKKVDEQQEQSQ